MKMKRILSLTLVLLMLLASLTLLSCGGNEGETEKSFALTVVHLDGTEKTFNLTSSEKHLGDALISEGIVEGENGQYGLYITTVDSEYHKYEVDGKYWAFYIDGEYAMTGVDMTEIVDGASYTLKAE